VTDSLLGTPRADPYLASRVRPAERVPADVLDDEVPPDMPATELDVETPPEHVEWEPEPRLERDRDLHALSILGGAPVHASRGGAGRTPLTEIGRPAAWLSQIPISVRLTEMRAVPARGGRPDALQNKSTELLRVQHTYSDLGHASPRERESICASGSRALRRRSSSSGKRTRFSCSASASQRSSSTSGGCIRGSCKWTSSYA